MIYDLIFAPIALLFSIVMFIFYFVPSAIAIFRKSPNMVLALIVNIFFGWTILGWAIALVLAMRSKHQRFQKF